MPDFKRTIDEMISRYMLEPKIKDIYVEGNLDVKVIRECLRMLEISLPVVYSIETIEISNEMLAELSLTRGNKQEVIAFATTLESKGVSNIKVLCLIDRDEDFLLGIDHTNNILRYVDYNTMDSYLHKIENLDKFIKIGMNINNIDTVNLHNKIIEIANHFFALRLAKKYYNLNGKWIPISNSLKYNKKEREFDLDKPGAFNRFIQSESASKTRDEIKEFMDAQLIVISKDRSYFYNSHDYNEIMYIVLSKESQTLNIKEVDAIPYLLLSNLEKSSIEKEDLFVYLKLWAI